MSNTKMTPSQMAARILAIPGGGSDEMHTYSTEEQIVGTWLNGKPLYEKTFTFDDKGVSPYSIDVRDLSIDEAFIKCACGVNTSSNPQDLTLAPYNFSDSDKWSVYIESSHSTMYSRTGSGYPKGKKSVVLCYTKTTDSAST